jgi:hypothetical protein
MNEDMQNDLPPNVSDHDLLIVLHTTMKHMARDVASIKDESMQRIAVVEATKYDKDDATKALADAQRAHDEFDRRLNTKQSKEDATKEQGRMDKINDDHEARMRRIERNMYIGMGLLAFLQFILNFAK